MKLYRKLSSSKKFRAEYGLFVAEGLRITKDALLEKGVAEQLLLTETAAGKFSDELFPVISRNVRVTVISDELGNKISSTQQTQGVFVICRMPPDRSISFSGDGKYIVLCNVRDPGNAGMIIRTADALGIGGVIMSGCCDLYSPKVIRSTMGSVFRMNIRTEDNIDKVFDILKNAGIRTYAAVIDDGADPVGSFRFVPPSAVFIGNEGNGLPADVSQRCDRKITIPMSGRTDSLNVAMAAGIIMWELSRV